MSRLLPVLGVVCLTMASPVGAQVTQDFSGVWEMDIARSETPEYEAGAPAELQTSAAPPRVTVEIVQTKNALFIATHQLDGRTETLSYPWAISDANTPKPVGTAGSSDAAVAAFGDSDAPLPARWENGALVTKTVRTINMHPVTIVERRTLAENGRAMVVETTVTVEHGYLSVGESDPTSTSKGSSGMKKDVYLRNEPMSRR